MYLGLRKFSVAFVVIKVSLEFWFMEKILNIIRKINMINNILITDVETTGLHPDKELTIEIGVILYNVKHNAILQQCSTLLTCVTNAVEGINGIPPDLTQQKYNSDSALKMIESMLEHADVCVAHNADFDKRFIERVMPKFQHKKWICTKSDFKWPCYLPRKRLQDVCEAMHVPYVHAHRALADCGLLAQCFKKLPNLNKYFNPNEVESFEDVPQ